MKIITELEIKSKYNKQLLQNGKNKIRTEIFTSIDK